MKIAVVGLWHLGSVTAACLAHKKFNVIAYDENIELIKKFEENKAPIFEPGLEDFITEGKKDKYLHFTAQAANITDADIIWITYDTPVDDQDNADVQFVTQRIRSLFPYFKTNAIIIISSQLPLGSTSKLHREYQENFPEKKVSFTYSPENLRLGKALQVFLEPDRIVMGISHANVKARLASVLEKITDNVIWMSVESAEMTKHAINAFLATSVVFINELATLCERTGADAFEVERGLKSEYRIGPRAYVHPGTAFAGGTLARDLRYLVEIGKKTDRDTPLFSAVIKSNQQHKKWIEEKLLEVFGDLQDRKICFLGLSYKSDTDTLRRSLAIEAGLWLHAQGAAVTAYDPRIHVLPDEYKNFIKLKNSCEQALASADAVILFTDQPEFKSVTVEQYMALLEQPVVIDPNAYLYTQLNNSKNIQYITIGRMSHVTTA